MCQDWTAAVGAAPPPICIDANIAVFIQVLGFEMFTGKLFTLALWHGMDAGTELGHACMHRCGCNSAYVTARRTNRSGAQTHTHPHTHPDGDRSNTSLRCLHGIQVACKQQATVWDGNQRVVIDE